MDLLALLPLSNFAGLKASNSCNTRSKRPKDINERTNEQGHKMSSLFWCKVRCFLFESRT